MNNNNILLARLPIAPLDKISRLKNIGELDVLNEETLSHALSLGVNINFLCKEGLQILTVLRLYDTTTFIHSVKMCCIAQRLRDKKINDILFRDTIIQHLGDWYKFLTVILLHDVGKMSIPHSVVGDSTPEYKWNALLLMMLKQGTCKHCCSCRNFQHSFVEKGGTTASLQLFSLALRSQKERSVWHIPFYMTGTSKETVRTLEKHGISPEWPLKKILGTHPCNSSKTMLELGFDEVMARLAGAHHACRIGNIPENGAHLDTVIAFVDLLEALISKDRPYKPAFSMSTVLRIVKEESVRLKMHTETFNDLKVIFFGNNIVV